MEFKDIAIVNVEQAKIDAYDMGYDRFAEVENTDEFDLSPYKSGASWANIVLPKLRAMAGHTDAGPGTWTGDRTVAIIQNSTDLDDNPIEADEWTASGLLGEIVDAFDAGAYDAIEDEDRDYDSAIHA